MEHWGPLARLVCRKQIDVFCETVNPAAKVRSMKEFVVEPDGPRRSQASVAMAVHRRIRDLVASRRRSEAGLSRTLRPKNLPVGELVAARRWTGLAAVLL